MELTRRHHAAVLGEDQRVVRHRVELESQDLAHMGQGRLHRAMDLRHTTQRIRILHAIALSMALEHFAVLQHAAHIGGGIAMALMPL